MSRIDSHIAQVQRTLAFTTFLEFLARVAFVLGVLALLVILSQRLIHFPLPTLTLWVAVGVGLLAAIVLTTLNRPTPELAAVVIDQRLDLKEKYSTALAVRRAQLVKADPFAAAVVRDAEQTASSVSLSGKFPVEVPRLLYVAVAAILLAGAVGWLMPEVDLFGRKEAAAKLEQQKRQTEQGRKMAADALKQVEVIAQAAPNSEEVKLARAQLEALARTPLSTPEATNLRVREALQKAEEGLAKAAADNRSTAQAHQAEKMFKSLADQGLTEGTGPVAEAARKLVEGNIEEAAKAMEQAVKDFDKQSPKEKEQLAAQMAALARQLQQAAQDPREAEKMQDQLQQALQQAGADPQKAQQQAQQLQQQIQQAMMGDKQAQQQLQQQVQQAMQQMNPQQRQAVQQAVQQAMQQAGAQVQNQQMAQAMQQMAQAMQQAAQAQAQPGNPQGGQQQQQGQQQMAQAQQQLQQMLQQMQAAQQDAAQMKAAQQAMQDAMAQACQGGGDQPGQGQMGQGQRPGQQGPNGQPMGPPGNNGQFGPDPQQGVGMRPKSPAAYDSAQELSPSAYNEKGKHLATVYVKDKSVRGEAKMALRKAIEAGEADASDDIDESRIDRRTQEAVRRYFQTIKRDAQ